MLYSAIGLCLKQRWWITNLNCSNPHSSLSWKICSIGKFQTINHLPCGGRIWSCWKVPVIIHASHLELLATIQDHAFQSETRHGVGFYVWNSKSPFPFPKVAAEGRAAWVFKSSLSHSLKPNCLPLKIVAIHFQFHSKWQLWWKVI